MARLTGGVVYAPRVGRALRKLDAGMQEDFAQLVDDLLAGQPYPKGWRIHPQNDLLKADLKSNHSWQVAFRIDGDLLVIEHIARHTDMDRFLADR